MNSSNIGKLFARTNLARLFRYLLTLAFASAALVAQAGFNQYSIGFNFATNEPNNLFLGGLADAETAGLPAVQQTLWNNLDLLSGTNDAIVAYNNGSSAATSVHLEWTSANTWASEGRGAEINGIGFYPPTNSPNHRLMIGYLDTGNATTSTVTITNVPSNLTTPGYDVYIYALSGVAGRGGTYRIVDANTSTPLTTDRLVSSATSPTNFVQDPGTVHTNAAGEAESGTYLVFRGLTSANIRIEGTTTVNPFGGAPRTPINAVQLVAATTGGEAAAATGLTIATNVGPGNLAISWTPGAGSAGSLVVVRARRVVTAQPVDGIDYNANVNFGLGENLGDDNIGAPNYVVYDGAGSSVTVSNLAGNQTYFVAVYSYVGAGGSMDYRLSTPATGSSGVYNPVTSIALTAPGAPVILGSARKMTTIATFANGTTSDITTTASYTSAAPTVVSFPTNNLGHLAALTNGVASFWASFQGFFATQSVTVVGMSMTHRYSFNEGVAGDTNFNDSVGGAHGIVYSEPAGFSGLDGGANVVFSGGTNNYAALPANLLTNYGGLTIEVWYTDASPLGLNWARILDFNDDVNRNMFVSPTAAGNIALRGAITLSGAGGEQLVSTGSPSVNTEHHVVWTLEPGRSIQRLFLDGVQMAINTNAVLSPEDIGSVTNCWLGRSAYGADPFLNGKINELRIYNGALPPLQIALDYATGTEVITNDPGACSGIVLTLTNAMNVGDTYQAVVMGNFVNAGVLNVTAVPEVTYTTTAATVATVNSVGSVTAVGPGNVTIRAIGFGFTNSVNVVITDLPLTLNHRYSFNGDYNDSVGGATATPSGATIAFDADNQRVVMSGTGNFNSNPNGDYVVLPPELISTWNSITIEVWVKETTNTLNFNRVIDFGGQDAGGTVGNRYIFIASPANSQVNDRAVIRSLTVGEQIVNFSRPSTFGEHHIVYTINAATAESRVYLDGVLWARNTATTLQPRNVAPIPNMWIGRSQFNPDPWFQGSINEVRLWRGAISAQQVALDYAAGPDALTTNLTGFSSVTVSNMTVGSAQQSRLGFSGGITLGIAPLAGAMAGAISNWVSSDPTVADVDSQGVVTAVGAGSATISATYNGTSHTSASFTVSAGGPALAHRYSFAGDATDSVGGANGANGGAALFSGGSVYLDGTATSYISLPGGLFSTDDVTFETWLTYSNNIAANAPAWDFGDPGPTNYFYFAPSDTGNPAATAGSTVFRYQYGNRGNQERTLAKHGRALSGGTNKVHYVHVLNRTAGKAELYINGVLEETYPYNRLVHTVPAATELSNTGGNIGRPTRTNAPPANMVGSVDEFRIWTGALNKQQVESSYVLGPDAVNPLAAGALQSISMKLSDSVMVQGAGQRPVVRGTFATAGTIDLTRVPGLAFSSSNPNVVAVDADVLKAGSVGSAQIIVSYGGKTATNNVTVAAKQLKITHRYSFTSDGSDSVGDADATLRGNARIETNHVVLDGTIAPHTYVDLPSDLIGNYDVLTIEAFLSTGNSANQGRLYDFGDRANVSNQDVGREYVFMSMTGGNGTQPRVAIRPDPGYPGIEQGITVNANLRNAQSHIVTVINSTANTITMYTNGLFAGVVTNSLINLAGLSDTYSMLGRSVWPDPNLIGAINDFRVYYGAMSGSQVAASFAAGPDPERLTATRSGSNVTLSWPLLPVLEGYKLQSTTSLTPPSIWVDAGAATPVGSNYEVTLPISGTMTYFRLTR